MDKKIEMEMRLVKQMQDMLDLIDGLQERVEQLEADKNQNFLIDLWRVDE